MHNKDNKNQDIVPEQLLKEEPKNNEYLMFNMILRHLKKARESHRIVRHIILPDGIQSS